MVKLLKYISIFLFTVLSLMLMRLPFIYLRDDSLRALSDVKWPLLTQFRLLLAVIQEQGEVRYLIIFIFIHLIVTNKLKAKSALAFVYHFMAGFLVVGFLIFRIANFLHFKTTGFHILRDTVDHFTWTSLIATTNIWVGVAFVTGVTVFGTIYYKFRDAFLAPTNEPRKARAILLSFCIFMIGIDRITSYDRRAEPLKTLLQTFRTVETLAYISPEIQLMEAYQEDSDYKTQTTLPISIKEKLKNYGVYLTDNMYPYKKNSVFVEPVKIFRQRPNIVLFVNESFNTEFIHHYSGKRRGLTPNIDNFLKQSLLIRGHYNSSYPTINGMVAMLCSHYPVNSHDEWISAETKIMYSLQCLPEILKENGYNTYKVLGSNSYFTRKKPFLMANGIDKIFDLYSFSEKFGGEPVGAWGYSDTQLMDFTAKLVNKNIFREPFFLIVWNADFHAPFLEIEDSKKFGEHSSTVENLAHTVDHSFQIFWREFLKSPYYKNSLTIFTSDHTAPPGNEIFKFVNHKEFFGEIPLAFHSPLMDSFVGEKTILSTQVDLAPTVLHLLGINVENVFEGLSLFGASGRVSHPYILGSHRENYFLATEGGRRFFNIKDIKNVDCSKEQRQDGKELSICEYKTWWNYKKYLIMNDKFWDK